ncbi:hypothetical protein BV898_06014 [Hypsibius exemplaris]|uniref:Receptor ligand binding region domain-containing protein n=1 Tax=Hypsibius exemplaris TaxID=2072580 RepID=A0A1W0WXT2_HYPEX|nr:hypothetical protein BV898_06014 [Hypsibius exemplaris]
MRQSLQFILATIAIAASSLLTTSAVTIRMITYSTLSTKQMGELPFVGPAMPIAQREVFEQYGLNLTNHVIAYKEGQSCEDGTANAYMVPEFVDKNWHDSEPFVIINPGCYGEVLLHYGRVEFPTAVNFAPTDFQQLIFAISDVFDYFSWTSIGIIYDKSSGNNPLYSAIFALLAANTAKSSDYISASIDSSLTTPISYLTALERIWTRSRVTLLLMHTQYVRIFMITAAHAGRTTSEYVYITMEPFATLRRFGNLTWQTGDKEDVTSDIALALYYTIMALGEVLHESIKEGVDLHNGQAIAARFRNRTFSYPAGRIVIGVDGVRMLEYCIRSMDIESGNFQAKLSYGSLSRRISPILNRTIVWRTPGNVAPPNEPRCGFSGLRWPCRQTNYDLSLSIPLVTASLLSLLLVIWYCRARICTNHHTTDKGWWCLMTTMLLASHPGESNKSKYFVHN